MHVYQSLLIVGIISYVQVHLCFTGAAGATTYENLV